VARSTDWALAALEPAPGIRVLDIGCGTGQLLSQLHELAPTVNRFGLDITRPMLDVARERNPTVPLVQASASFLPFATARFDAIVSTSALHYLTDPRHALRDMHRVLKPGGTLVVTDWCRDDWLVWLLDLGLRSFLRRLDPAHGRTLRVHELTTLLTSAGFRNIVVTRRKIDRFWGLMTAHARA
jgi:ubiquinone/menaquinone biosynthesis C-methylase UbiE